jgi:transmembrane sensor
LARRQRDWRSARERQLHHGSVLLHPLVDPVQVAAFSLGRIAYDERRNFGGSADWFQTYLREEPAGTLAREASERLIEAYRATGNLAAARDAAKTYLATCPAGPHAALAQSLVHR